MSPDRVLAFAGELFRGTVCVCVGGFALAIPLVLAAVLLPWDVWFEQLSAFYASLSVLELALLAIWMLAAAGLTILAFPLGWQTYRHLKPPSPAGVLFLRCFRGLGDSALIPGLLRSIPAGVQVAFIASPAAKPSSWDPVVLPFAGIRWQAPWKNVPLFLRSTEDTWQRDAGEWIGGSHAIVVDVSKRSASLDTEISLIHSNQALGKTLWLVRETPGMGEMHFPSAGTLVSRLSWRAALPRMLIGVLAAGLAGYKMFEVYGCLAAVALASPLIVRPELDRASIHALRQALLKMLGCQAAMGATNAPG